MSFSLHQRSIEEELMDDPAIHAERFIGSLRGLHRVNRATGSPRILWPVILTTANKISDRPLRVLDVACGGGDNIIDLSRRAQRAGLEVQFHGSDVSPLAIEHAQSRVDTASVDAHFFVHDAVTKPIPDEYDIIMCSLFLHHLNEDDALSFLRKAAEAAQHTLAIHDLVRQRSGYWLAWFGTRALLCNDVCHHDGPLSVSKAFTLEEMSKLASDAGLENGSLEPRFPGRFLWVWHKGAEL